MLIRGSENDKILLPEGFRSNNPVSDRLRVTFIHHFQVLLSTSAEVYSIIISNPGIGF